VQHIDSSSNKSSSPAPSTKEVGPPAVKLTPEDLQRSAVQSKLRRVGSNALAADSEGSTRQAASLVTAEEGEGVGSPSAAGPIEVPMAAGMAASEPREGTRGAAAFTAGAAAAIGAAAAAAAGMFPGVKAAVAGSQPVRAVPPGGGPSAASTSTSAVQEWLDENVATPKLVPESFPPSPLDSGRMQGEQGVAREQKKQQPSNKARWKKPWSFGGASLLRSGQATPKAQSSEQEGPSGATAQALQTTESAGAAPAGTPRPRRLLSGAGSLQDPTQSRQVDEGGSTGILPAAAGTAGGTPAQKLKAAARRSQSSGIGRGRGSTHAGAAATGAALEDSSPRTQRRVCTYTWWMIIALVGLIMVVVGVLVGVVAPRTLSRRGPPPPTGDVGSLWFTGTAKISARSGSVAWRCEDILGAEQVRG
jgi:hypothetical protein